MKERCLDQSFADQLLPNERCALEMVQHIFLPYFLIHFYFLFLLSEKCRADSRRREHQKSDQCWRRLCCEEGRPSDGAPSNEGCSVLHICALSMLYHLSQQSVGQAPKSDQLCGRAEAKLCCSPANEGCVLCRAFAPLLLVVHP